MGVGGALVPVRRGGGAAREEGGHHVIIVLCGASYTSGGTAVRG